MRSNDNWNEEDELDTFDESTETDNRKNPLRKVTKEQEKRIKELTERLEKFERQERESTVSKVLESKGVNSKAARLVLKDLDEVNEEAVNNWLRDNGDLIGYTAQEEQEAKPNVREFSRQDSATQFAATPDASDEYVDLLQNYDGHSEEELLSIIQGIANKIQ